MKDHQPNIKHAVEELIYILELELATPAVDRNAEIIAASRIALTALIGTHSLSKAREFLNKE